LALDLHKDAVTLEDAAADKIAFLPFVGIAPRQYLSLFAMRKRKEENGTILSWIARKALPVTSGPFMSYFEAEDWLGAELDKKMKPAQLTLI